MALVIAVHFVVYYHLVAEYLRETFYILAGPGIVHFTVAAEFARHQVVLRFNTSHLEAIRIQLHKNLTAYLLLRIGQEGFNVPHNWVVELSLMEPVAVE